jgi:hypothetical protein
MAKLTFLELQQAVMGDRFSEDQRGDVKSWINARYWGVWSMERWTFRFGIDLVTVTSGSEAVTGVAADVERVHSFLRSDGTPLQYVNQREFEARYYNDVTPLVGPPEAYTLRSGSVFVGPASNETKNDYELDYEKAYTALSADTDVTLLPEGADLSLLVFGAQSLGLKLQNDFTWQFAEQTFMDALETLRSDYLSDASDDDGGYPRDAIGFTGWGWW